jgi:hypothetical protein
MRKMKLNDAIKWENNYGAKAIGLLLQELAAIDKRILPMVEQDLENENMSLAKCYGALRDYAEKHKQGNSWACPVVGVDPDNEVIKIVMEFYKIPAEWIKPIPPKSQTVGQASGDEFDLMGLL